MKNVYLTLRELRHGIILVIEALLIIDEIQCDVPRNDVR
jgi:hypothetical protein